MTEQAEDVQKVLAGGGRKRRGRALAVLALLALLAGGAGYGWYAQTIAGAQVSYVTEPVVAQPLTVRVTATGTVQPTTQVEVSSELSGTLATVDVDYNDAIEVGQVLARLDSRKMEALVANAEASLARAKAQVAQAEAAARLAGTELARAKELGQRGISAHAALETAEAEDLRAKAELDSARADLTLAEANLRLEQADLDKATIRSPIRGIVLNRTAEVGQIVASSLNAPVLFTLAEDLSQMELQVDVDEADIGQVSVGNTAQFTVEAWRDRPFPAEITQLRFAPEDTEGVVTYKAVLSVDNSEGLLRPGMTATADITVRTVDDALTVPNAALRFAPTVSAEPRATRSSGGSLLSFVMPRRPPPSSATAGAPGRSVWVMRQGVPVEIPVTPGLTDGQHTEVKAEGLAEGDLVIVDQTGG
jgi:HlyD family secretion protein